MVEPFNFVSGMKVVVLKPQSVVRTTRERWLSWPWRPWVSHRVAPAMVPPDRSYLDTAHNTLYCGEHFYDEMLKEMKRHERRGYSIGGKYVPRP